MKNKLLARLVLVWTIWPLLALGIGSAWFAKSPGMHLGITAAAAEMSQEEFEQRIRTYLIEHPEVLEEALNRLEAKQGEQAAAAGRAVLKDRAAEVFQDPASPVSGNPKGDVTLVEFFDYNCPYCRAMVSSLAQAEAADPRLRIVYKEFPILGAGSVFAAKAALAANKQGKYVAFHRALYQLRGPVDETKVLEVAANVGIDIQRMKADMQDAAIEGAIEKNVKLAEALRITGTPGFVVGDQISTGATDFDGLQALIAKGRSGQTGAK
jgi:protein-disulfide isomerase